jgi:hypothetical protein
MQRDSHGVVVTRCPATITFLKMAPHFRVLIAVMIRDMYDSMQQRTKNVYAMM